MADLLLVDDSHDINEAMEMLLTAEGHRVRIATDGKAGLRALEERFPDLIVLDVEMPELDGPGMACRMLIENSGREKIPIVFVSGVEGLHEIARRIGTPYMLGKPCDPDKLLSMLARALEERIAPRPPK
ncbi:response regulator [Sorangium sp. So ce726]|uniref:response regulator n=1 Tax=Sorangium sp. So ce726 TaxID=3133319 RepID=UPI003F610BD3